MDGDHRTTDAPMLFYDSYDSGLVHTYLRVEDRYVWTGLTDRLAGMKVNILKPGQRS